MKILIAGYGFVGQEVEKLFLKYFPDIYDINFHQDDMTINVPRLNAGWKYREVPKCKYDFCFVCVSTPPKVSGECDISAVEDVIEKIDADVFVIRSTIPPGTTDYLEEKHSLITAEGSKHKLKNIVFQPEYVASSSPYPAPLADVKTRSFHILGGLPENTKKVRRLYEKLYPPTCTFLETTAKEAEIVKLMENSYIATKVTFCNEFYRICEAFGVDYDVVREGFLLDPRMEPWWTYITKEKGWGGHCLGKDTASLVYACENIGYEPKLIKAVREINKEHRA